VQNTVSQATIQTTKLLLSRAARAATKRATLPSRHWGGYSKRWKLALREPYDTGQSEAGTFGIWKGEGSGTHMQGRTARLLAGRISWLSRQQW